MQKILVTGAAGFIGHNLSRQLLADGRSVVGLDNLNDYYDPELKKSRLAELLVHEKFKHANFDMADRDKMAELFESERFDGVVNLAAQAGVRYSLINPQSYIDTNLVGLATFLKAAATQESSIFFMPRPVLFMGQIQRCRFLFMIMLIIRFLCMQLPKRPMN